MTRYLLWVIAPHHQHITASSLHFTRCHYILQELAKYPSRIEKIWQALLSSSIATKPVVKTLIWRASNSCGLTKSWNQPDKKQLQGEQQNRKDNFGNIRRRQSLQISCLLLRFVSFQDSCGKFWSDGSQCVTLGITQRPLCWVCQPAENVQASGRHGGSLAPKWLSSITFVPHQSYRIDLQWEPQEREESTEEQGK